MDIRQQNWFSKRLTINGAGSSSIATMTSGLRWNLYTVNLGWNALTTTCTFNLYEIDDSQSSIFFGFGISTSSGYANLFVGGVAASATNTRLMANVSGASGTVHAMFTGWTSGGA